MRTTGENNTGSERVQECYVGTYVPQGQKGDNHQELWFCTQDAGIGSVSGCSPEVS